MIKGVNEKVQNVAKEQNGEFHIMLLGTLGASLLENLLTGKAVKDKMPGNGVIIAGKGTIREGLDKTSFFDQL